MKLQVIRSTPRPQENVMQAWEYDVIYIDPNDLHQKQNGTPLATRALNRMGQQGWEALTVVDLDNSRKAILFKRPCEQGAPTEALADSTHPVGATRSD
jgi:hypothetical protein